MPELLLDFDAHGDGIGAAWTVLSDHALRSGPDAPVVTCPDWRMHDLLAHQGTVHRWATAILRGQPIRTIDTEALEREGLAAIDQRAWLDAGAKDLLQALVDAPEDLDVFFFLADPPPPRRGWARRQCHETTIHAVDAMSASLGRAPRAAETWIRPELAADGVDELLTGFVPRPRQKLRAQTPLTVVVEAADTGHAWTMRISAEPVVTTRDRAPAADVVLTGTAAQLYLGLWNRGDELDATDPAFLDHWREQMRVTWS
jgi:uncharacterized protein (TIGR03083 family)